MTSELSCFPRRSPLAATAASVFLAALAPAQTPGPMQTASVANHPPRMAPYDVIDRVEGAYVHTNEVPVRPLAIAADGSVWSVNTHASTIERFAAGTPAPVEVRRMPLAPVAIAGWNGTGDGGLAPEILVSCAGSSCLVRSALDGTILDVVRLPAGPRDVIVDQARHLAFVACALDDSVVQLDLTSGDTVVYGPDDFTAKKPTFLSFAPDGDVIVTPLLSGNNSTAERAGGIAAGDRVLDLADPDVADLANGGDLPDEDVFAIDPLAQTVTTLFRAAGSVLFAHGVHPTTGQLWVLNTEALNKDPERQTEPSIRGEFAQNRVTILSLPAGPQVPQLLPTYVDLDQRDTTAPTCPLDCPIDPARTLGQPYQLAFDPSGLVFVCGLLTDRFFVLDAAGGYLRKRDLPDGAIPRGLLLETTTAGSFLWVHCWGTNEVRKYKRSDLSFVEAHQLSHDPTPALVKEGRRLFYDAAKSRDNNLSCATCHVEGESDLLMWNLSDGNADDKGPMMTQTLAGIERMRPFHWRGERAELVDFNPAFDGLLGGSELDESPGGEFDAFQAFVFSIQNRPNPNQSPFRLLDDSIAPRGIAMNSSAVNGQRGFKDVVTFGVHTCNECHQMPLGTNNDDFPDIVASAQPKRARFNVAPFHGIEERADMPADQIRLWVDPNDHSQGTANDRRAYLGAGTAHSGLFEDLESFVGAVGNIGGTAPQLAADITAFVYQFDTGLAPASARAIHLHGASSVQTRRDVQAFLVQQAELRNCSLAVFGKVRSSHLAGAPLVERRWSFVIATGSSGHFESDDPLEAPRTFADFLAGLAQGEDNVFVGLPYGVAGRWAIDADLDGLRDAVDGAPFEPFADPNDDAAPSFLRGPQSTWSATQTARILFDTDEPTRYEVTWQTPVEGVVHSASSSDFSYAHSLLLTSLLPSTAAGNAGGDFGPLPVVYDVSVTVTDRTGNQTTATILGGVATQPFIDEPVRREDHVLSGLDWTLFDDSLISIVDGSITLHAAATVSAAFRMGGPPPPPAKNRVVVARVLVDGEVAADIAPAGTRTFAADLVRLTRIGDQSRELEVPGPFLVSLETDVAGESEFEFLVHGLASGQQVALEIAAVAEISADLLDLAAFHLDGLETSACRAGTLAPDADCDGDQVDDCCRLDIPIPKGQLVPGVGQPFPPRRFAQWSFPRTPAPFRMISGTIH